MNRKIMISLVVSFLTCFCLNLLLNKQIIIALLNSSVLILSVVLYLINNPKIKLQVLIPILLTLVPLFQFNPKLIFINIGQIMVLLGLMISLKFYKFRGIFLVIILGLVAYGSLLSGGIVDWPFSFNKEHIIFYPPEIKKSITLQQEEALYLPYRLRTVVYNQTSFAYLFFTNLFGFLSLRNLYDVILLANIYPLILGLFIIFKSKITTEKWLFGGILIAMVIVGINKSPDKFNSLFFISPILLYLILTGFQKVNLKIYGFLYLLSLIMITSPKI